MSIKQPVIDMSELIRPLLSINDEGVITAPDDLYAKTLPTDNPLLTMDSLLAHQAHRDVFLAGATKAVGDIAVPFLKAHPDKNTVSAEYNIGVDVGSALLQRSREFNGATEGEKVTKYGHMTVKYQATGAANKGQLKQVYLSIQDDAEEALKD